jgi:hypothetical protein
VSDGGNPDRNYGRKVLDKADAGFAWQVSIGGDPSSTEEVKAGNSVIVNGRTSAGPVIVARGVQIGLDEGLAQGAHGQGGVIAHLEKQRAVARQRGGRMELMGAA